MTLKEHLEFYSCMVLENNIRVWILTTKCLQIKQPFVLLKVTYKTLPFLFLFLRRSKNRKVRQKQKTVTEEGGAKGKNCAMRIYYKILKIISIQRIANFHWKRFAHARSNLKYGLGIESMLTR